MPWNHFKSPLASWSELPSFVIGQALFIGCAIALLVHAWRQRDRGDGNAYLFVWVGALVAGTANDLIFMALPLVDNFWHAQANVMLTARLPLYIPCVYVCFMYFPTVAVRKLRLSAMPQAALTGLVAVVFYAPYDITGAKLLWWTWHDTDLTIANRILGAPVSSSLWVLTFSGTFAWLVDRIIARDERVAAKTFVIGLAVLGMLTTLLMVLQMTVLQQLDPLLGFEGTPGYAALTAGVAIYLALVSRGWSSANPKPTAVADVLLYRALMAHFIVFIAIMAASDPATHRSTGVHQPVGRCYVQVQDITGLTRHEYLCASDFHEDFHFGCATRPKDGQSWYTICGRPHQSFPRWLGGVSALGVTGLMGFSFLLGMGPFRRSA
jgi:hypothetical protein